MSWRRKIPTVLRWRVVTTTGKTVEPLSTRERFWPEILDERPWWEVRWQIQSKGQLVWTSTSKHTSTKYPVVNPVLWTYPHFSHPNPCPSPTLRCTDTVLCRESTITLLSRLYREVFTGITSVFSRPETCGCSWSVTYIRMGPPLPIRTRSIERKHLPLRTPTVSQHPVLVGCLNRSMLLTETDRHP